ncbi:MAG: carbon-nitrogen hydrolase family protein [Pseudomonadota bacterium]
MKAAVIQMNSGADVAANLEQARGLLEQAATTGAVLAVLPENCAFMGAKERDKLAHAESDGSGPIQQFFAETAARLKLWLLAGTLPIRADSEHVFAASCLYDASGARAARYDKIHLFDVEVPGSSGERYRESNSIAPGALRTAVVETPLGRLGLSVCYDLRFPELYRALATERATLLSVPAAFTAKTGVAHWHTLLKARAVENQCYVLAPGQCGTHPGGRSTYGHSLIVGPWGETLAEVQGDAPGFALADIDRDHLASVRASFPALTHRRL